MVSSYLNNVFNERENILVLIIIEILFFQDTFNK
jgi:hypothetical protein